MKITCVLGPFLPVPPAMGGAVEKIWQSLCNEFATMGHEVTLISRQFHDYPIDEIRDGVRYLRIKSTNAPTSKIAYRFFDLIYALRVTLALPMSDITITNSVSLPILIPRSRAGRIYVSVARYPKGQLRWYARADRLQAVSTAVEVAIRTQSPHLGHLAKTVPNCLSPTFVKMRPRVREARNREILYAGRIAKEKGLEILLRAYQLQKNAREWTLTLIGPSGIASGGSGTKYLDELKGVGSSHHSMIRFEEPIYDESILAARLQRAEIFVYPSTAETGESFGMAPLEAMTSGCAVVVSSLQCFRDFVNPNINAVTFDHTDLTGQSLAVVLEDLMNSPAKRAQLGSAAIESSRLFDPKGVAKLFVDDFGVVVSQ
jgi:glycosyltransferase involved in cell wall biosynthesis